MLTIILYLNPNIFILYMLLYMYITFLKKQIINNLEKIKVKGKIFYTNINSKYTLIPFNKKKNYVGITKYFPADSKEWKDKIYFFNKNFVKNLFISNTNISEIIKTYLNIYLKNNVLLRKYISRRQKRYSINKVFTSKPEIKYTNSKVIITVYIYDREFLVLLSTLIRRRKKLLLFIENFMKIYYYLLIRLGYSTWKIFFRKKISNLFSNLSTFSIRRSKYNIYWLYKEVKESKRKYKKNKNFFKFEIIKLFRDFSKLKSDNINKYYYELDFFKKHLIYEIRNYSIDKEKNIKNIEQIKEDKEKNKKEKEKINNVIFLLKSSLLKDLISIFHKQLLFVRKLKMKLNFNILKFKEIFLYGLKNLLKEIISKYHYPNINIILNIVNLQSIVFNSDTSTEFLKWKLRPRRARITVVNLILKKIKLIKVNKIIDRARHDKNIDFNYLENKYTNLNINSILYGNFYSLDNILHNLYKKFEKKIIFNYIKYKNIKGIRLEIKGRLTKRYRADRSIYKVRLKGGLRNIDASYRGLSTVNFRGSTYSNVEYSMKISKRRIGAFAVKGWISGR